MPAKNAPRVMGGRFAGGGAMCTKASRRSETQNSAQQTVNGTTAPKVYRKPPTAGPVMVASWVVDAEAAIARGNSGVGTTVASKVCWVGASKARPTPKTKTAARMNSLLAHPETAPNANA